MLAAISERQRASRDGVTASASELLHYLADQQRFLLGGALVFLALVVAMTLWLRTSVILRLQAMAQDVSAMEQNADLTKILAVKGRDEVAGVAGAIEQLVRRFEVFVEDVRSAASGLMHALPAWITERKHCSKPPKALAVRFPMWLSLWLPSRIRRPRSNRPPSTLQQR